MVANIGLQMNAHMRDYLYLLFLALSALTCSLGGWVSARFYKLFNGSRWKRHSAVTILAVPAFACTMLASNTLIEMIERANFG